jgi:hypothetical protein
VAGKKPRSKSEIAPYRPLDGVKIVLRKFAHRRSNKPPLVNRAELTALGDRRRFSSRRDRHDQRRKGTGGRGQGYDADRPLLVKAVVERMRHGRDCLAGRRRSWFQVNPIDFAALDRHYLSSPSATAVSKSAASPRAILKSGCVSKSSAMASSRF